MKIFTLLLILFSPSHSFHVSVADLVYNTKSSSLEMSQRIFIDDLEKTLQENSSPNFNIEDSEEVIKPLLSQYLENNITFHINEKQVPFQFLGYKIEDDVLISFIEVTKVKRLKSLTLENRVLTELHKDQTNLVHFKRKNEKKSIKSFKFTFSNQKASIISK